MLPKSSAATNWTIVGRTRLRIDFDLADVAAGREGEVRRVVEGAFLEAGLHARRQVVRGIGGERHLEPGQRFLSVPATLSSPFSITMSAFVGLQQMRRDLLAPWPPPCRAP